MAVSSRWQFSIHWGLAGFEAIRADWQVWRDQHPAAGPFQTPQWHASFLRTLADQPEGVCFITARRDGRLAAVLPLQVSRAGLGRWGPCALQTLHGPHMDLCDLAWPDDAPGLGEALLRWLQHGPAGLPWHTLKLSRLREDSPASAWWATLPDERVLRDASRLTAWIDCSQGLDHALREVSRSHRQNVKRLVRRAEGQGALRYEVIHTPQALPAALDTFLCIEASGWKGDAGTAIAHTPRHRGFYEHLVAEFAAVGACRINLLHLGDEVIAAQFGLLGGRQLHLLKIAFDQAHASVAPGNLIMQHTIESVCADPGLDRLSFVTHPPWAHLWKPQATAVVEHALFRDNLLGQALHRLTHWRRRQATADPTNPVSAPAPSTDIAPRDSDTVSWPTASA